MKKSTSLKSIILLFLLISFGANAQRLKYHRIEASINKETFESLMKSGLDIDHYSYENNVLNAEVSDTDISLLEANKVDIKYIIKDVEVNILEHNAKIDKAAALLRVAKTTANTTPLNFGVGGNYGQPTDIARHYTFQDMQNVLDQMRAKFPKLISVKSSIGKTVQGRDLFMVKISDNPDVDENEPETFLNAVHHSNEPMSMTQLIYFMWNLLENYNSDKDIQTLLNSTEIFIVPCVNPDGYEFNIVNFPFGGGTWRKNRNGVGIDNNRNYSVGFGFVPTNTVPTSPTYCGPSPFSELENQAIKNFSNAHNFITVASYHATGNNIVIPNSFEAINSNSELSYITSLASFLAEKNAFRVGNSTDLYRYVTGGDAADWHYSEQITKPKSYSFIPEIGITAYRTTPQGPILGDGFYPPSSRIIPLCSSALDMNKNLLEISTNFATVTPTVQSPQTELNGSLPFTIKSFGILPANYTVSLNPISTNIESFDSPIVFSSLTTFTSQTSQFNFKVKANTLFNTNLSFQLLTNNGYHTRIDTITILYDCPVNTLNTPSASLLADATCANSIGKLVVSNLPAGNWFLNPGNISGSTTTATISNLPTGIYQYTVSNALGCRSLASNSLVINELNLVATPSVRELKQPDCLDNKGGITITNLPSVGNWTLTPGNIIGSGDSFNIDNLSAGNYSYTVKSSNGCVSLVSNSVTINNPLPFPEKPIITSITQPGCGNFGKITFSNLPSQGIWIIFPIGAKGSGTTYSLDVNPGLYNFSVSNQYGCFSQALQTVLINPNATPTVPIATAISQPTCSKGGSIELSNLPTVGNYTITDNSTPTRTVGIGRNNSTYLVSNVLDGNWLFQVTNQSGCKSGWSNSTGLLSSETIAAPSVNQVSIGTCKKGASIELSNLPTIGNYTITHSSSTITSVGKGATYTITSLPAGYHNYIVKDANGCYSNSNQFFETKFEPLPTTPKVYVLKQPSCYNPTLGGDLYIETSTTLPTWTLNPGNIKGFSSTQSVFGLQPGKYNYTLTDQLGCVSAPSNTVTIVSAPAIPKEPIVPTIKPLCTTSNGDNVFFTVKATGSDTILWYDSETNPNYIFKGSTYSFNATSTKTLYVSNALFNTFLNNAECESKRVPVVVKIISTGIVKPLITVVENPTCENPTASIEMSGLPAGSWTINPGSIKGTTNSYKISNVPYGIQSYTVTSSLGCDYSDLGSVNIIKNPGSPYAPTLFALNKIDCTNGKVNLQISNLPLTSWTINPESISGNTSTYTITNLSSGTYSYSVVNDGGCISPSSSITVKVQPNAPLSPIVSSISQPNFVKPKGSVTLTNLPANGNWTVTTLPKRSTIIGSGTNVIVEGLDEGLYTFRVLNSEGCESPISKDVMINKLTPPIIVLTNMVLSSDAPTGNQWYNQNGLIPGATGQTYTPTLNGPHYVVFSNGSVTSTPSNTINITFVGLEDLTSDYQLELYPNPVKSELMIELKDYVNRVNYQITNSLGQVIQTGSFINTTKIQTEELSSGVYFIKLNLNNTVINKKFVKD